MNTNLARFPSLKISDVIGNVHVDSLTTYEKRALKGRLFGMKKAEKKKRVIFAVDQIVLCGKRFGYVTEASLVKGTVTARFPNIDTDRDEGWDADEHAPKPIIDYREITFHTDGSLFGDGEVLLRNADSAKMDLGDVCRSMTLRLAKVEQRVRGTNKKVAMVDPEELENDF